MPVFLELAKSAVSKPLVCFSNGAGRKNLTLPWVMGAAADPFLHISLLVVEKTFSHLKVLFSFKVLGLIVSSTVWNQKDLREIAAVQLCCRMLLSLDFPIFVQLLCHVVTSLAVSLAQRQRRGLRFCVWYQPAGEHSQEIS